MVVGGTRRRDLDRQAKAPEDPGNHGRLLDARDQAQTAATPGTRQHGKPTGARHERRPTLTAGSPPRRLGRPITTNAASTTRTTARRSVPAIISPPPRLNAEWNPSRRLTMTSFGVRQAAAAESGPAGRGVGDLLGGRVVIQPLSLPVRLCGQPRSLTPRLKRVPPHVPRT